MVVKIKNTQKGILIAIKNNNTQLIEIQHINCVRVQLAKRNLMFFSPSTHFVSFMHPHPSSEMPQKVFFNLILHKIISSITNTRKNTKLLMFYSWCWFLTISLPSVVNKKFYSSQLSNDVDRKKEEIFLIHIPFYYCGRYINNDDDAKYLNNKIANKF